MAFPVRIHFDNAAGLASPRLWVWNDGSAAGREIAPTGSDGFGPYYDLDVVRNFFQFKFKDSGQSPPAWEPSRLEREAWPLPLPGGARDEMWCRGDRAFVYHQAPAVPGSRSAEGFVRTLRFAPGLYVPGSGGLSGFGAHPLAGGGVLFGFYHPNASRV
jgi:hypothetical protein